jgi:hypothetical protein
MDLASEQAEGVCWFEIDYGVKVIKEDETMVRF